MKKRHHEDRVVRIFAAMEGEAVPISEVSVPRAHLPIDVVLELDEPSRCWGPLRTSLAHRTVVVEHYSRSPGIAQLSRSLCKHAYVVQEWWRSLGPAPRRAALASGALAAGASCAVSPSALGDLSSTPPFTALVDDVPPSTAPRPPALLLLSAGLPRQALSGGRIDLPATLHAGIWYCERPLFGDIILVHLRGLPKDAPGCAVLRFMATPRSPEEADDLFAGIKTDPFMLDSERNRLMEHAMNGSIPITEYEKGSILKRIQDEGKERWLKKGERSGMRKGRVAATARAVLRVLEARGLDVSSQVRKRILAITDLEVLEAWIERSLKVTSADELFE